MASDLLLYSGRDQWCLSEVDLSAIRVGRQGVAPAPNNTPAGQARLEADHAATRREAREKKI